jgi:hypothetical protein
LPKFDDPARTSQWTSTGSGLEISVAAAGEAHDVALEILTRLSQALWERLSKVEESGYWRLLDAEILANISGEMDEQALDAKRLLLEDRTRPRSALPGAVRGCILRCPGRRVCALPVA